MPGLRRSRVGTAGGAGSGGGAGAGRQHRRRRRRRRRRRYGPSRRTAGAGRCRWRRIVVWRRWARRLERIWRLGWWWRRRRLQRWRWRRWERCPGERDRASKQQHRRRWGRRPELRRRNEHHTECRGRDPTGADQLPQGRAGAVGAGLPGVGSTGRTGRGQCDGGRWSSPDGVGQGRSLPGRGQRLP